MRTAGFIAFGVAVQQAAAHRWTDAPVFSSPSITDNHCNPDQQRGFDWSKLVVGENVKQYGEFGFQGFIYVNSFHNKRDLAPRTSKFQDKCIKGSVTKNTPAPPKISCDTGKKFSIREIEVTTSEDLELEFIYGYDNGDRCKYTASCSKSGSTIKNSQCGGATSVTFKIPEKSKYSKCDVGIHRVNFDCGPPSRPSSPPSSSSVHVSKSSTSISQSSSLPSLSTSHGFPTGNLSSHAASGTAPATGTAPVTIPLTSSEISTPASTPVTSTIISSGEIFTSTLPVVVSSPVPSVSSSPASTPPSSSPFTSSSDVATASVSSSPILSTSTKSATEVATTSSSEVATTLVSSSPILSTIPTTSSSEVATTPSPILSTISTTPSSKGATTLASSSPILSSTSSTSASEVASTLVSSPPVSSPASIPASSSTAVISTSVTSEISATSSVPEVIVPVVTTQIVVTTLTTCPVTNTVTSGTAQIVQSSFTVSTILSTITSTVCTQCVAPITSTPASGVSVPIPTESPSKLSTESVPSASIPVSSVTASITQSSGSTPIVSVPVTTHEVVTTQIIRTTLTTCPVTETITSGTSQSIRVTQTVSTVLNTITSTICTKCVAPTDSQIISTILASQPSSAPSSPPVPAPPVLPKCLNTWITLTKCESNADSNCYCKDSEFTKNVQDCVSSWSADSGEIQAALSYLAGICAPDVEVNPGIVTNVPITITLAPGPIATPAPPGSAITVETIKAPGSFSIPVTVISLVKTVTVPITFTSGSSIGQAIPSSSTTSILSIQVTVPQVKFTTENLPAGATGRPNVDLAAGSPAPVPAVTTPAGFSTFATGRLPTGGIPAAQTSITPFTGGAGRVGPGILGAMIVGALGLLVGL